MPQNDDLADDERRILIAKHAEGIAKRVAPGAAFNPGEDIPWLRKRVERLRVLLDEVADENDT